MFILCVIISIVGRYICRLCRWKLFIFSVITLLNVVLANKDIELGYLLADTLLLMLNQTTMTLIVLLVFFEVGKLLKRVQLLIKLALNLGLRSEEV